MRDEDASRCSLVCSSCGLRMPDDGVSLECPGPHGPALLKSDYGDRPFAPDLGAAGIHRYRGWLPIRRAVADTGRSIVYRSDRLGAFLGLKNLWIAFNGYWPERGAGLITGSFKELEAATVIGRLPEHAGTLVVTSAGNTAAAFAELCSVHGVPAVVIVPADALGHLRSRVPYAQRSDAVRIVAVDRADYADAIALGDALAQLPGFVPEGGTKNVGRRDGLGTVMLAAAEAMDGLPEHYVQAIGSGAGAIAAHEAAVRLQRASGSGDSRPLPRLMLAQNSGFAPVYEAWRTGRRPWETGGADDDRAAARGAFAPELTNRKPPYDIPGGLRETLTESAGEVFVADGSEARAAMATFLELEGIDIEPPAGVALAALRTAVRDGRVDPAARILLNITGGGRARLAAEHRLVPNEPDLVVPRDAVHTRLAEIAELTGPFTALSGQAAGR
ncbi:cysteate synthase [Kitasatospora sp. NPDC048296]|uniref:cysteate synthase n=1 Tax=Kitasatospora sp. NPDC048296 TaxID=3364048 RepID=UPI0037234BA0